MARVTLVFEDTPDGVSLQTFVDGDPDDETSAAALLAQEALKSIGAHIDEETDRDNEGSAQGAS